MRPEAAADSWRAVSGVEEGTACREQATRTEPSSARVAVTAVRATEGGSTSSVQCREEGIGSDFWA
jgi:hypothetical protein